MAAGQGFKTFTTGEVLTAGDVNGYLMQGINVFASTAARDAAITSPQEGQFAFTKDTNGLWYYDGAAWVASGATGDIEGVTAGIGISGGGTSGTVTITNSMATAIDAKGDLVAGTGADAFSRLAVGTNGQVLKANSATATGLEWGTSGATGAGARAYGSFTVSSGNNVTATLSSEYFDTDNYHDNTTNNSRLTIPAGKGGIYVIIVQGAFTGNTGQRQILIYKNGSTYTGATVAPATSAAGQIYATCGLVDQAVAGDYYTAVFYQTSGANMSCECVFSIGYLGA